MASPPLVLPGALFVGEDDRARVVAHTGPAAGWFVPRGIQDWSFEVAVVVRDALTDDIRKATKLVMPEEQIPPAKNPLTLQAALKSPLIAVSSKLTSKLVEMGARVHTVGVDRISSSFYYLAEGGGEDPVTVSGDLVAAVAAMLGERADNAAIERVLDGLADRLVRSLSRDRVSELAMELAHALPRAAADGSGAQGVDLDAFEKELASLVAASEKFTSFAQDISSKLKDTYERKLEVPLFGEARKVSQGPFELTVGDQKVALGTYERWVMSGPLTEPKPQPKAEEKKVEPKPEAKPQPKAEEKKAEPKSEPKPQPKAEEKKAEPKPSPKPAAVASSPKIPAATPPRAETPKPAEAKKAETPKPTETKKAEPAKAEEKQAEPAPLQPTPIVTIGKAEPEPKAAPKVEEPKPEPAKAEPVKAEEPKAEPAKAEEPKPEPAKAEAKAEKPADKAEKNDEPKAAAKEAKAEKADKIEKAEKKGEKTKAIEPAKSSSSMTMIMLVALAIAGAGVWYFFLRH